MKMPDRGPNTVPGTGNMPTPATWMSVATPEQAPAARPAHRQRTEVGLREMPRHDAKHKHACTQGAMEHSRICSLRFEVLRRPIAPTGRTLPHCTWSGNCPQPRSLRRWALQLLWYYLSRHFIGACSSKRATVTVDYAWCWAGSGRWVQRHA